MSHRICVFISWYKLGACLTDDFLSIKHILLHIIKDDVFGLLLFGLDFILCK